MSWQACQWHRRVARDGAAGGPRDIGTRAVVTIVNTDVLETRPLIIEAGAFGEHNFSTATLKCSGDSDTKVVQDGGRHIQLNQALVRWLRAQRPPPARRRLQQREVRRLRPQ
eukprot:SAG31_NODE_34291_length_334_cov_1.319149_1_plen_111_part_11